MSGTLPFDFVETLYVSVRFKWEFERVAELYGLIDICRPVSPMFTLEKYQAGNDICDGTRRQINVAHIDSRQRERRL